MHLIAFSTATLLADGGKSSPEKQATLPNKKPSCKNVTKGDLCQAIEVEALKSLDEIMILNMAGIGCASATPKKSILEVERSMRTMSGMRRMPSMLMAGEPADDLKPIGRTTYDLL